MPMAAGTPHYSNGCISLFWAENLYTTAFFWQCWKFSLCTWWLNSCHKIEGCVLIFYFFPQFLHLISINKLINHSVLNYMPAFLEKGLYFWNFPSAYIILYYCIIYYMQYYKCNWNQDKFTGFRYFANISLSANIVINLFYRQKTYSKTYMFYAGLNVFFNTFVM